MSAKPGDLLIQKSFHQATTIILYLIAYILPSILSSYIQTTRTILRERQRTDTERYKYTQKGHVWPENLGDVLMVSTDENIIDDGHKCF